MAIFCFLNLNHIVSYISFTTFLLLRGLTLIQVSTIMTSTLIEEWKYLFDCNQISQYRALNSKLSKFPLDCGTVRTIHAPIICTSKNQFSTN